jgi:thiamine-monophosphate kinase
VARRSTSPSGEFPGSSEEALVAQLASVLERRRPGGPALLGIGDDAAVLKPIAGRTAWTVDTSVEGVHFDRRWLTPADIGARSFHAAVSDLAAMGARPVAALSSLIVPRGFAERELLELARGQAEASRQLGCSVVGGNLFRGGELSVTTTALGALETAPLTREGARAGDEIWLLGDAGLSAAGLRCLARALARRRSNRASQSAIAVCVGAWRRPKARIRDGLRLIGRAHAVIDVSDGLGVDAGRIAAKSGVRMVLEASRLESVLRPELLAVCRLLGEDALSLAVTGGEDYSLLATGPPRSCPRGARRIGRVERGAGAVLEAEDGRRTDVSARGFDHFGKQKTMPKRGHR